MSAPDRGEARAVSGDAYECVRCGTRVSGAELSKLPSPTCANCGYRVFKKVRTSQPREFRAR